LRLENALTYPPYFAEESEKRYIIRLNDGTEHTVVAGMAKQGRMFLFGRKDQVLYYFNEDAIRSIQCF
jgi:hypothetical protein